MKDCARCGAEAESQMSTSVGKFALCVGCHMRAEAKALNFIRKLSPGQHGYLAKAEATDAEYKAAPEVWGNIVAPATLPARPEAE